MVSANHGNISSFSNSTVTSHNDHHTVDSNHPSSKITPTFISKNQFETHIIDIDRELRKFDSPPLNKEATSSPDNHTLPKPDTHLPTSPLSSDSTQTSTSTPPPSFNTQLTHNLATSPLSPTQTSNPSPSPSFNTQTTHNLATSPLNPTQISNPTLSPSPNTHTTHNLATSSPTPNPSPTWKRIPRATVEHALKEKVVRGMKRTLPSTQQQSDLPNKRHVVSQIDEENI